MIVHNPIVSALAGSLATLAHDSIMTPLDCVKQRMQLGLYKHTWHAFKVIIKTDGIRALYASYFTTLLMNIPNSAILVACNDFFKRLVGTASRLYREEGVSAFFMGAKARIFQQAPAAALSWTVYETVKRLLIKATNAEY
ncbi:hypothetical protein WA158_004866 [Blastocystis sp. Blastoise]